VVCGGVWCVVVCVACGGVWRVVVCVVCGGGGSDRWQFKLVVVVAVM